MAAIYDGFVNGDPAKEPRIVFNGLVGNIKPFYSTNFQTLQAGDLFMLAGKVSTMGVQTTASQTFSTDALEVTLNPESSVASFRSSRPGTINFDLGMVGGQMNMGSANGVTRVIIDGLTNFNGTGVGLAVVGRPVQEAAAAAAAASNSTNLKAASNFSEQFTFTRNKSETSSVSVIMDEGASTQKENKNSNSSKGGTSCSEDDKSVECKN